MAIRPDGARILLTGASSGIGRELAGLLAASGARLALVARCEERLREVADELPGGGHVVLPADLSRPGTAAELGERVAGLLGGIDVLINNAGVSAFGSPAVLGDDHQVRAAFETNFWSPLALARSVLPAMLRENRGTIVTVTSTVQAVPLPLLGYYSAAKAALAQATRAMRHELRDTPVRVLEVVPGSTDTALRDVDLLPWKSRRVASRVPGGVPPTAVAGAVVRGLRRGKTRVVYPRYSLVPLEIPAVGRLVAAAAARLIDTSSVTKTARPGRRPAPGR
jgi:short-subunit dehydrogenase